MSQLELEKFLPTRLIGIIIILILPFQGHHFTEDIQTRQYRALEVIIGAVSYLTFHRLRAYNALIRPFIATHVSLASDHA